MLEMVNAVDEVLGYRPNTISQEILSSSKPLVLRGLVSDWPLVTQASRSSNSAIEYLKQFDSGKALTAMVGEPTIDGRIFYNEDLTDFNFKYSRMVLGDIFEKLIAYQNTNKPPMIYVGSTNIDNWLPGFRNHNDLDLGQNAPLASIWIGNRSRVAPHYDFPTNIACCVAGRRRFTVFPPNQLENMYVGPIDFSPAGQPISLVDVCEPDFQRFPKFKEALKAAQTVELEPGDAIFIPSMWWHHVEAMDDLNILVNYWWRNSPSFMGPPLSVLQHAILGMRDLPDEQRRIWRDLFDFYVFNYSEDSIEHIPSHARGALNPMTEEMAKQIRSLLMEKFR